MAGDVCIYSRKHIIKQNSENVSHNVTSGNRKTYKSARAYTARASKMHQKEVEIAKLAQTKRDPSFLPAA